MSQRSDLFTTEHGIAGWPDAAGSGERLPDSLPDGRPWPAVRVLVLASQTRADPAASLASLAGQGYPRLRYEVLDAEAPAHAASAMLADPETAYWLWLRAGDVLAPGALAALCLEAVLTGAGAVAGLRVLYARGVLGLDVLADPAGAGPHADSDCGDVLVARDALSRLRGLGAGALPGSAGLWARLGEAGVPLSRIGRPVLLRHEPRGRPVEPPRGLSIAALTDLGYGGGAGIAHRRLAEALTLSGHRVTHLRLADESPPAAAEWTDRFPRTEAAIREGGHDLVLAGNLHGATRGGGLLARLSEIAPTMVVLHDLFPLTGRCAHPKDCPVIASGCDARCPSPTAYPQLAPSRIGAAFEEKRAALSGPHAPLLLANSAWTEERARAGSSACRRTAC